MGAIITFPTLPQVTQPNTRIPASGRASWQQMYYTIANGVPLGQREAVWAYMLMSYMKLQGETDYTSAHGTMFADAQSLTGAVSDPDMQIMQMIQDWATVTANIAPPADLADVPTMLTNAKDLIYLPRETMMRVIAMLKYRMLVGG